MDTSTCPCCGYKSFDSTDRGNYDICPICYWEDDPIQSKDFGLIGGANRVSLKQAQRNFVDFGACESDMIRYVRKPMASDVKDPDWQIAE